MCRGQGEDVAGKGRLTVGLNMPSTKAAAAEPQVAVTNRGSVSVWWLRGPPPESSVRWDLARPAAPVQNVCGP